MFTGLVEEIGTITQCVPLTVNDANVIRLSVACSTVLEDVHTGDSIAVNGVCLTVVEHTQEGFSADVMDETLSLTTLSDLSEGAHVNMERALLVGSRLGGHLVQGHVDGTAMVLSVSDDHVVRIGLTPLLKPYVAYKGSITLNGVSLTVSAVGEDWCEVSLIPETLQRTTFGEVCAGDSLNVEVDALAKYVHQLMKTCDGHDV